MYLFIFQFLFFKGLCEMGTNVIKWNEIMLNKKKNDWKKIFQSHACLMYPSCYIILCDILILSHNSRGCQSIYCQVLTLVVSFNEKIKAYILACKKNFCQNESATLLICCVKRPMLLCFTNTYIEQKPPVCSGLMLQCIEKAQAPVWPRFVFAATSQVKY